MEIKLRIVSIENNQAVLKLVGEDAEIVWPINSLPKGISEGDYLNFLISASDFEDALRIQKAKDILNEILNVE